MRIERIRQQFEEWYATTGWDQHSQWHPLETLEYDKDKYPFGRYTVMSLKQTSWEVWLAASTHRYKCNSCQERREIRSKLGYARIGANNA